MSELVWSCRICKEPIEMPENKNIGNLRHCKKCKNQSGHYRLRVRRSDNPHANSNQKHLLYQIKTHPQELTSEMLAAFLNCRVRRVYQLVSEVRKKGHHINKVGENGVYEYVGYLP